MSLIDAIFEESYNQKSQEFRSEGLGGQVVFPSCPQKFMSGHVQPESSLASQFLNASPDLEHQRTMREYQNVTKQSQALRGEEKAGIHNQSLKSLASQYSLRLSPCSCVTLSSPVQSKRWSEFITPDLQIGKMWVSRTLILFRCSPRQSWHVINLKWATASFLGLKL
ncbi:hypothetical protein NPIL_39441 [Nephila pilipes]|uniref:Uncharacterized protein n=1 Tax=Nephila pilipes TaxID=299642 RepID=A0A8X6QRQ8_NEPPI|nr:hypothetical protein NPIL_39441 [Nephila pilipes]